MSAPTPDTRYAERNTLAEEDFLLILRGLTQEVLQTGNASGLFPLSAYEDIGAFADAGWKMLGVGPEAQREVFARFSAMFPHQNTLAGALDGPLALARTVSRAWEAQAERQVVFCTSGSTGLAKKHAHSMSALWQETIWISRLFSSCRAIVAVVPQHHLFGFNMSLMLSRYLQIPLRILPPLPTIACSALQAHTLVTGFPDFWKAMLKYARGKHKMPEAVQALTSTAPCPPEVLRGLYELGCAKVTEIYGSSETGATGYRHDGEKPFNLPGYLQRSEKGIRRVLPSGLAVELDVQDNLFWEDENSFKVSGRLDKAVQVAGINVYPSRVANFMRTHPAVKECAVRLMRPSEGGRLKAFIVPAEGMELGGETEAILRHELKNMLRALPPAERPTSLTFGAALPVNPIGKLTDWDV